MIDCLIVGFNDWSYPEYVRMSRAAGSDAPGFRDLNLNFVEHEGSVERSMDVLNRVHRGWRDGGHRPFHNADFFWPVVAYLTTFLRRRGYRVEYVNLFQQGKEELATLLAAEEVRLVAVTTTLYVLPYPVREVVSFVRQHAPRTKVVAGGPHILNLAKMRDPEAVERNLQFMGADYYVVSSEGEQALAALLACLQAGQEPRAVPNLGYLEDGRYVFTPRVVETNALAENMVDYRLFPSAAFGEFVSLRTAKSCPFSCSFCNFPEIAGDYVYLPVELVERELDAIREIGSVTTLTFIDDTFNVPKKRFKEILRMMIRNDYGFRWNCFYRCDHGDAEAIELMHEAGCEGVFLGVESGSDTMLAAMNKTARGRHYREAIPLLRQAGIVSNASLVLGFPGESEATLRETMDFLEETRPDFFGANLWYFHPLTPIAAQRERWGLSGNGYEWRHATMDAATACGWVERMFLEVEGSTWLPEDGFEFWSVFYLQRKGMPLAQVKAFARSFNEAVRQKLTGEGGEARRAALMAALEQSCVFAPTAVESALHV